MAIEKFNLNNLTTWGAFPGNVNRPMGLGLLGNDGIVFKRKFRWTMLINFCLSGGSIQQVPEEFVKVASRPSLDIEETQIDYLHGRMWLPGKGTWQDMTVTYYDVAGTIDDLDLDPDTGSPGQICLDPFYNAYGVNINLTGLFGWIASTYNFLDPCTLEMGSKLGDYQGEALIRLYDGCGQTIEAWLLSNVWPKSINFGELSMESSDTCDVELTLKYSQVQYRLLCPAQTIQRCPCTPCN